ncbi:MAG TPA: UTP--glucose-1-phosphate uridylyltransferase [Spirochaetota bacterium]|nr:UTP--glucose-1-phosphate uridylyltransferase [Spirochaetota bacterium]
MSNKENKTITKIVNSENNHIFYFWESLNEEEKKVFLNDIRGVDLNLVKKYFEKYQNQKIKKISFEPTPYLPIEKIEQKYKNIGEEALLNNEVAVLTVAGGQASRLGYEQPKGCFPITPLKNKSLFRIFSEKILFYSKYYKKDIKWFIMTSDTNYDDTKTFFEKNNYFGLKKEFVRFFEQGMLPTVTLDGKLILKEKNRLFLNPDGHGGILTALNNNGLLNEMKKDGIKYLSYFQVDNPLVNLLDPYFIGYHILSKSDVTTKVVKKLYPDEKLGSIVKNKRHSFVIEYSDLPKENMFEKEASGELKYPMGSIGIHCFSVDFLAKFTKKLEIHFARKVVDGYLFKGNEEPKLDKIEAIKFETFIFDIIKLTKKSFFFETERIDDFAPLKNKTGVDSIETTILGQIDQFFYWLKYSGIIDKNIELVNKKIEISPLYAPDKNIFLEKTKKEADKLKRIIFNENGLLNEKIYID